MTDTRRWPPCREGPRSYGEYQEVRSHHITFVAALMFGGITAWAIWLAAYVASPFAMFAIFTAIASAAFFVAASVDAP